MKKFLLASAIALLSTSSALAADMAIKAIDNAIKGYPYSKCGIYYGIGTGGSVTGTNSGVVGEKIVQGELDALVGYSCPLGAAGFWFIEGSAGVNNLNGSVNGLALTGPLVLIQRAGVGSPINSYFPSFGNGLSLPSLPILPNGVSAGPANGYFFAGMVEQKVNQDWLIAPIIGVGLLYRLSDGVVADTWAGWQMNSQSVCFGAGLGCGRSGNGARVGVAFKY